MKIVTMITEEGVGCAAAGRCRACTAAELLYSGSYLTMRSCFTKWLQDHPGAV